MPTHQHLIPSCATAEQRRIALLKLADRHVELRAANDNVVVSVEPTPDGDLYSLRWPDRELPIMAS